jgi:hypothetical protein
MRWRWKRGKRRGRPSADILIHTLPAIRRFVPEPMLSEESVVLNFPELEAVRFVDLENLSYEDAAEKMGTSRGTVWRLVKSARAKIIRAIMEGRPLEISQEGEIERVEESKVDKI